MNITTEKLLEMIGKQAVMIDCLEKQLKEAHAQLNDARAKNQTATETRPTS